MIKVADIASYFNETIYTLRRNAKLLLGPDDNAGRRQGKARFLIADDAFQLWLGTALISSGGFKVKEVLQILEQLIPWLKREGFYIRKSKRYAPQIKWAVDDKKELRGVVIKIQHAIVNKMPAFNIGYRATIKGVERGSGLVGNHEPGTEIYRTAAQNICPAYAELCFPEVVNIFNLVLGE
jgi:hypothetical protein